MGVYAELRGFVLAHRTCGVPSGTRDADTDTGFRLRISCPCGARFDRWLASDDADADLLRQALRAFEEGTISSSAITSPAAARSSPRRAARGPA
jgi:hypothetical protein